MVRVKDDASKKSSAPTFEETDIKTSTEKSITIAPEPESIPALINGSIFDDKKLLEGFAKHYKEESKNTLLAMIQDETVDDIKIAAAVRAFREEFALEIFSKEKENAIHILIRQLNRADSAFIDVEIMWTLCCILEVGRTCTFPVGRAGVRGIGVNTF